jgi:hypothetical protein
LVSPLAFVVLGEPPVLAASRALPDEVSPRVEGPEVGPSSSLSVPRLAELSVGAGGGEDAWDGELSGAAGDVLSACWSRRLAKSDDWPARRGSRAKLGGNGRGSVGIESIERGVTANPRQRGACRFRLQATGQPPRDKIDDTKQSVRKKVGVGWSARRATLAGRPAGNAGRREGARGKPRHCASPRRTYSNGDQLAVRGAPLWPIAGRPRTGAAGGRCTTVSILRAGHPTRGWSSPCRVASIRR